MATVEFNATDHQHTRFNPLTGQWVLVSPHRMKRPWLGQEEELQKTEIIFKNNPLCPGVIRPNGKKNPNYESTFVFTNDFPALLEDIPIPPKCDDPLFQTGPAQGTCRVMCFHPKSNKNLSTMSLKEIQNVIQEWIKQYNELKSKFAWIQIFENKGSAMGCSNPHPHCQIWACSFLPSEPKIKDKNLKDYYKKYKKPLLDDYVAKELEKKERIVLKNNDWIVVVPFWAIWPFETMLISRNSNKSLSDLLPQQINNLAKIIKELTIKYDNLFQCSFPYSMGWHGAPGNLSNNDDVSHWTLHALYYPPLLRSANIRKFMVGFELLCQPQRDLTAEQAAEKLRQIGGLKHYSE